MHVLHAAGGSKHRRLCYRCTISNCTTVCIRNNYYIRASRYTVKVLSSVSSTIPRKSIPGGTTAYCKSNGSIRASITQLACSANIQNKRYRLGKNRRVFLLASIVIGNYNKVGTTTQAGDSIRRLESVPQIGIWGSSAGSHYACRTIRNSRAGNICSCYSNRQGGRFRYG